MIRRWIGWLLASPAPVRGDRARNRMLLEAKEAQLRALKEMAVGAADEDLIEYVERRERALKRLQIEYEAMRLGGSGAGSGAASAERAASRSAKRPGAGK